MTLVRLSDEVAVNTDYITCVQYVPAKRASADPFDEFGRPNIDQPERVVLSMMGDRTRVTITLEPYRMTQVSTLNGPPVTRATPHREGATAVHLMHIYDLLGVPL